MNEPKGHTALHQTSTVRAMRTATITTATVLALLAGGTPAQAARPAVKPGGDAAVGHLVRQHDCRPGVKYGGGVTGWLVDDKATARRDLRYVDVGHAQQTWTFTVTHHCYR